MLAVFIFFTLAILSAIIGFSGFAPAYAKLTGLAFLGFSALFVVSLVLNGKTENRDQPPI